MKRTAVRAAFSGFAVLLFLAFFTLAQSPAGANIPQLADFRTQLAATAVDHSITFEYGKPIKVLKAIDGDTLELVNGEHVRYIGIDTPEEFDPRKPEQCYAREAAAENARLVQGKDVIISYDKTQKDKYGRWLGFIYLADGTFVNETLVREGYAFAYDYKPDVSKSAQMHAAENAAKTERRGLWTECEIRTISSGRKQTNDL